MLRPTLLFAALAGWLIVTDCADAHDPGVSAAHVRLTGASIDVTVGLDRLDALRWLGRPETGVDSFSPRDLERALRADASTFWAVRHGDRNHLPQVESVTLVNGDDVRVVLRFAPRPEGTVHLVTPLVARLARGHRHLVTVSDSHGRERLTRLMSAGDVAVRVDPLGDEPPVHDHAARGFFMLGVEHILIGFDHLLFLLALLLAGGGLMNAVRTVTAFTVAHSITLAIAALGVWQPSGAIVEPLIALSIVLVAVENLIRREKSLGHRWTIAFALGLVHGFGFAGVLAELGVPASAVVPSLFGFNLGVEAGQIAVVLVTYPLLAWLHRAARTMPTANRPRRPLLAHVTPALSVIVAVIGSYWFVERTLL